MLMQTHEARLHALRAELARHKLDGFIVPIADEHMSEYIGAYAQRLAWLTGFGGSAGTAVVLKDKAAIFVDGRYTIQVQEQVNGQLYEYRNVPADSITGWIAANITAQNGADAPTTARIGFDPWLHTSRWASATGRALSQHGAQLVPVATNPVDAVWHDRPEPSSAPAFIQDKQFSGRSSADKRAELGRWLRSAGLDAIVVSALDSIAWLLNIRGSDVDHTPVALSFLIVRADATARLFIAPDKITPELLEHLGTDITILPRSSFEEGLADLTEQKVAIDSDFGVAAISQILRDAGAQVFSVSDPTILAKAIKNPAEQAGHRAAQLRDGVAVAKFLHWLSINGPQGSETELSAAARLHAFRQESGLLKDLSFDTISAAGPHAAIPHYRVDEDSNLPIAPGSVYLVDSGGQYPDGTTDITRTVWISRPDGAARPGAELNPGAELKDRFTRVLKGHIALATQTFPQGTSGAQLDSIARQFLWADGADYAHGTGHGVGSFLAVHEGPQRIAKPRGGQAGSDQALIAGMILSNEPGFYKAGEYGIRTENLILVEPREFSGAAGTEDEWLGFETLTFAPIDATLVDRSLLTPAEITWWNEYHAQVQKLLSPHLEGETLLWLKEACQPL